MENYISGVYTPSTNAAICFRFVSVVAFCSGERPARKVDSADMRAFYALLKIPAHLLSRGARDRPITAIYGGSRGNHGALKMVSLKREKRVVVTLYRSDFSGGFFLPVRSENFYSDTLPILQSVSL